MQTFYLNVMNIENGYTHIAKVKANTCDEAVEKIEQNELYEVIGDDF